MRGRRTRWSGRHTATCKGSGETTASLGRQGCRPKRRHGERTRRRGSNGPSDSDVPAVRPTARTSGQHLQAIDRRRHCTLFRPTPVYSAEGGGESRSARRCQLRAAGVNSHRDGREASRESEGERRAATSRARSRRLAVLHPLTRTSRRKHDTCASSARLDLTKRRGGGGRLRYHRASSMRLLHWHAPRAACTLREDVYSDTRNVRRTSLFKHRTATRGLGGCLRSDQRWA